MAIVILAISGVAFIALIIMMICKKSPCKGCRDRERCWYSNSVTVCPYTREE